MNDNVWQSVSSEIKKNFFFSNIRLYSANVLMQLHCT